MKFEVLEHTADIGIKSYGGSLKELFENAATGMFSLMIDPDVVKSTGEFEISLTADDEQMLLVDWLTELLYIHEVYGVLLNEFDIKVQKGDDGMELAGVVRGEAIDDGRHHLKTMIKAVTYHMLEIDLKEGYLVVIFDI
jgi:SHS2 domain-containing protein